MKNDPEFYLCHLYKFLEETLNDIGKIKHCLLGKCWGWGELKYPPIADIAVFIFHKKLELQDK